MTALELGSPVQEVYLDADRPEAVTITRAVEQAGLAVTLVSANVIKTLSEATTPQGTVAIVTAPTDALDSISGDIDLVLVLAEVGDPGNAGTLVRSAVAAGAGAVVFSTYSVDALNPKTVRAAAGHLWATKIIRDAPVEDVAAHLKKRGFRLIGTSVDARKGHDEVDLTGPSAIVVGNEGWGIPVEAEELMDELVAIRMPGPTESLNAGIAGSILLFEAVRQRSAG